MQFILKYFQKPFLFYLILPTFFISSMERPEYCELDGLQDSNIDSQYVDQDLENRQLIRRVSSSKLLERISGMALLFEDYINWKDIEGSESSLHNFLNEIRSQINTPTIIISVDALAKILNIVKKEEEFLNRTLSNINALNFRNSFEDCLAPLKILFKMMILFIVVELFSFYTLSRNFYEGPFILIKVPLNIFIALTALSRCWMRITNVEINKEPLKIPTHLKRMKKLILDLKEDLQQRIGLGEERFTNLLTVID